MNATILRLSAQALLGRRRFWLLLAVPLVLVVLAFVVRLLAGEGVGYDGIIDGLGLRLSLPIVALMATSTVLGPEIDDGSIVYLLAKPVSRYRVALSKYVVALAATLVFGVLPLVVASLLNDGSRPGMAVGWLAGASVSALAYCGLFLALSAVTRHAVVVGLLFVLLWEGLLGGLLTGIRWLNLAAWGRQVAAGVDDRIALPAQVGVTYALVAAVVVAVLGVWFTGERLRSFSLVGGE